MNLFDKQTYHYIALIFLVAGVYILTDDTALSGQLMGVTAGAWMWLSIAVPILHQVYVWFFWRTQLRYSLISKVFGENGFKVYTVGFTVLFASRLVSIVLLSLANRNSIALNPGFSYTLSCLCTALSVYLFYSVRTYFGFQRAYGIDHFDEAYRHVPFVRKGIFRFTPNAMYTFGFLILWVPGLIFYSKAALLAAGFNHIYIWVHYFTTELPDIRYIYGSYDNSGSNSDMDYICQFKEWRYYFEGADVTDIKTIVSRNDLRTFIAAMLSYYPWWIVMLYRIRSVVVHVLGLVKHEAPEELPNLQPGQISFTPGEMVTFFSVRMAEENVYWFAETPPDRHLKAYFGVVAESLANDRNRYYVVTIVHYLHWTGPLYFNLIRPFHHLVVARMARAGARAI